MMYTFYIIEIFYITNKPNNIRLFDFRNWFNFLTMNVKVLDLEVYVGNIQKSKENFHMNLRKKPDIFASVPLK